MHAGDDDLRADELRWALTDPAIRAVIAARGGYGTARVLGLASEAIDGLAERPRWIVGFSDLTALLSATLRLAGLQAIHGSMVCQVGRRGKETRDRLVALLEGGAQRPIAKLQTLVEGRARGPLVGGNLTVLTHLVGTPWMPDLRGAILFIEDVGERPYRLDRCLVHLRQAGALEGVVGVVIGDLTDCEPQGGEAVAVEITSRFCRDLGVPAVAGLPAGHGPVNVPLVLGAMVELDASLGSLSQCTNPSGGLGNFTSPCSRS